LTEKRQNALCVLCALIFGTLGLRMGAIGFLTAAAAGWLTPGIMARIYQGRHLSQLNKQLVPTLNLLSSSLSAGESLQQAIESSRGVMEPPMSDEFAIINRQLILGRSVDEALEDFAKRVPLNDVRLAVKAMVISLHTGMNILIAISHISDTIRQRNAVQGKVDALTAQGKAQGVVIGSLPIVLGVFLYWRDPESMSIMFTTLLGRAIIIAMIFMEIAAFFVIRKIITIDI
jgi:tight adherence protein B